MYESEWALFLILCLATSRDEATVTAHRGHNQLPHFLGDRQPEVLHEGLFQSEVCENDNPLHITTKYLISAHAWGK